MTNFIWNVITLFISTCILLEAQVQGCTTIAINSPCSVLLPYDQASVNVGLKNQLEHYGPYLWNAIHLSTNNTILTRSIAVWMCSIAYVPCISTNTDFRVLLCIQTNQLIQSTSTQSLIYPLISSMSMYGLQSLNCSEPRFYNLSIENQQSIILPNAQLFQMLMPRCESYEIEDGFCEGILPSPVYVPPMTSQIFLESRIIKYRHLLSIAPIATGCRERLTQMLCTSVFMSCDQDVLRTTLNLSVTVPFPRFPCQQTCNLVNSSCSILPLGLNCISASSTSPPLLDYPISQSILGVLGEKELSTTCTAPVNESMLVVSKIITCPNPLVLTMTPTNSDNNLNGGSCSTPCPNLVWSKNQWTIAEQLVFVLSILSFIGTSFALCTWTIFIGRRKQQHSLWMFMLCQWLVSTSFVVGFLFTDHSGLGLRGIGCNSTTSIANQNEMASTFQGVLLMFSVLASVSWWMFLVFHLFVQVVYEHRFTTIQSTIANYVYHIFTWSSATIFCIIALGLQLIGRGTSSPWILFKDDLSFYSTEFPLFYLPIMIMGGVGVLMMVAILIRLLMHRKSGSKSHTSIVRPCLFVTLFLVMVCFLCGYRFWMLTNQSIYQTSAAAWLTCLLQHRDESLCGGGQGDDARPPIHPPVILWYTLIVCCAGEGVITATFYLSQISVWKDWFRLIVYCLGKKYNSVHTDPVTKTFTRTITNLPNGLISEEIRQKRLHRSRSHSNGSLPQIPERLRTIAWH